MALELHMDARLIVPTDSKSISWIAARPPDSSLNVEKAQRLLANKPANIKQALNEFSGD